MTIRAYYNEHDAYAADWIRNLVAAGLITAGDVDTRSIVDVQPSDLRGYTRCHFFAGIGVWDYALGLAGWPADRPVWTGSCPCQPFSAAGRRGGLADERHLWPAWHHLIAELGPSEIFGEQVASADGLGWLDLVHADLDGLGYAFGAADLCAAGVGAPHIRQRLWFVAHAADIRRAQRRNNRELHGSDRAQPEHGAQIGPVGPGCRRPTGIVGNSEQQGGRRHTGAVPGAQGEGASEGRADRVEPHQSVDAGATRGAWSAADWIPCRDGKARPVRSGTFPLAHGAPARMGRLRAYGNAIVPQVAATFVAAYLDSVPALPATDALAAVKAGEDERTCA